MRPLMLVMTLAFAASGAACSDENPVAPSSLPGAGPRGAGAFRNRLVFVPDKTPTCASWSQIVPPHRVDKC